MLRSVRVRVVQVLGAVAVLFLLVIQIRAKCLPAKLLLKSARARDTGCLSDRVLKAALSTAGAVGRAVVVRKPPILL